MSAVPNSGSSDGLFDNLKDIFGGIDDLTGGNLGNLAAGAAGIDAAAQQKRENTALVAPLKDTAQPFLDSGLSQLGNYQNLSPLQQQALDAGKATGATLTGEADPLLKIGQDAFSQYQAGTLPAWQQAALDKKIATAKALNKQALGSNIDSSSLGATEAGIDTQSMIAQGQLLQANLATGQNAYKQGTDLQVQGGQFTKGAYDKAVSDVNQNLQNAINTTLTGLGPLQSAIQIEIAGNTALTGQLQALFGALAKSLSAGSASRSGSSGSGVSSIASGLKNLFGGSKTTDFGAAGNAAMADASNIVGGLDTSLAIPDFVRPTVPNGTVTVGEPIADGLAGATGLASSFGSSALPAGTVTIGEAGLDAAGAAGAAGAGTAAASTAAGLTPDAALAASLAPVEGAAGAAGGAASGTASAGLGLGAGLAVMGGMLLAAGILSNNDGTDQWGGSLSDYNERARSLGYKDYAQQKAAEDTVQNAWLAANPGKDMTYLQPDDPTYVALLQKYDPVAYKSYLATKAAQTASQQDPSYWTNTMRPWGGY